MKAPSWASLRGLILALALSTDDGKEPSIKNMGHCMSMTERRILIISMVFSSLLVQDVGAQSFVEAGAASGRS